MTDAAKHVMTELSEAYEDVVRGMSRMSKHLGADADEAVSEAAKKFVHAAADLSEKIKKQSESLAKRTGEEIEEIKEHPVATAAVAAAAVGLLGYAITRKPRH
jgi:ElaB/YqjD/DUF883 family membrane-anchored ribosome-binding protein